MKIKAKQYAEALLASVKGEDRKEAEEAVVKLASVMAANNQLSQLGKVLMHFEEMWDRDHGIVRAEVSQAFPADKAVLDSLNRYVKEISVAQSVELSEKIDKSLIGGVVVKFGDRIIDHSLKNRIKELKRTLA